MLKLSQKCYEERYQNPLGGKEQEKIISAILKMLFRYILCRKRIFFNVFLGSSRFYYENNIK
jgi:hypothetical protein